MQVQASSGAPVIVNHALLVAGEDVPYPACIASSWPSAMVASGKMLLNRQDIASIFITIFHAVHRFFDHEDAQTAYFAFVR